MSEFVDGRYEEDELENIIDAMMDNARHIFGNDLNDDETAAIRLYYAPIAQEILELQKDLGLVMDSAQIEHADGTSLDLLTALIGVTREPAKKATGEVRFYRDTAADSDYTISSGTEVTTEGPTPEKFITTETVTLESGTKEVYASIEAVEGGVEGNVGANTITNMPDKPSGVEYVNNPKKTDGGQNREGDEDLRERAQEELANGARATAAALYSNVVNLDPVKSVTIKINDTSNDNTGSGGLPPHSFELIVEGGTDQEIAQAIFDTKSVGDTSYGGATGTEAVATAKLGNGQTFDISFSRPVSVGINFDIDLEIESDFEGKDVVKDNIVEYVGGTLSSGNNLDGDLGVGDDVIQTKVMSAIMETDGIHDVTLLEFDATSDPTNTTNYAIASNEVAITDATDGSFTINTTQV